MKKMMLTIGVVAVMLSSCIKGLGGQVESMKKNKIGFKLGGVNHNVGEPNVGFPTEPLKNFIAQLTIIAYNTAGGTEVARQTQLATSSTFGQINFELPNGTYNFVAIGSNSEFGINQFYDADKDKPVYLPYAEANFQYWQPTQFFLDKFYKTSDTFFAKRVGIAVNSDQTIEVIMERIVGLLNVVVTDLPNYIIDLQNDYTAYRIETQISYNAMENDFGSALKYSKDGPISYYIIRTHVPVGIRIRNGSTEKYVEVSVPKNKRTTLTGQFATMNFTSVTE
ncbi:hypothetical protein SRABI27_01018 [Pedobacter sp. Bi27]|nr:hypothetical protein SRABI27_01018 [Pedobacter sp. Bi27]